MTRKKDTIGNPEVMTLIGKTHLTYKRFLQKALVGADITLKQYYLLLQLKSIPFLYPAQVSEMLYCDRPTTSVIIRNMEKQGWILRERDPDNGKMVRLYIRKAGREKVKQISRSSNLKRCYALDPLGCFSKWEADSFMEMLNRLYEYVDSITSETIFHRRKKRVVLN